MKMSRYALVIDTTRCIGCYSCRVACQNQNRLPFDMALNKIIERENGRRPLPGKEFVPVQCNQCQNPVCITVCEFDATHLTPEGVVTIDSEKCEGCEKCIEACPFGMRFMDEVRGIAVKCSFCIDTVREGGIPACVQTCPTHVRLFGDLDDPRSEISRFIAEHRPQHLRPDLKFEQRVLYKGSWP